MSTNTEVFQICKVYNYPGKQISERAFEIQEENWG